MENKIKLITISILVIAFLFVIFATNRYTGSDPSASLLVTESILKNRTVKLDHYGEEVLNRYGFLVRKKNDHFYYYFPLGTSIASLPFVAIANGFGFEMSKYESEMQIVIAALTSVLTLFFLIKLARLFLGPINALLISSVFWFGSSLASTSGTALWSHNFATLFGLLAIYGSIKATKYNKPQVWPFIATALFAAYLCRPTMALLAPFVLLYLFSYYRSESLKAGLLLASLLAGFIAFSMHEFLQYLPDYYLPQRLAGGNFQDALFGNLFSPARGLLIYSPFIILAWLCYPFSEKNWVLKKSWLLIGLAWPVLHLVFVSRFPHWWAGWSYGSRFMTDIIPGLFLLTLFSWPTNVKGMVGKVLVSLLTLSSVFAIVINSGQGLFNKYTPVWNAEPNIDKYPQYLYDWGYPQFLANKKGHEARLIRHSAWLSRPITPDERIDHDSERVEFIGWSSPEHRHRWSSGVASSIEYLIDTETDKFEGELNLRVGSLGKQRVYISFNGKQIFYGELNSSDEVIVISFSPSLFKNGENLLEFSLPDARQPGTQDSRVLALALKSIQIK